MSDQTTGYIALAGLIGFAAWSVHGLRKRRSSGGFGELGDGEKVSGISQEAKALRAEIAILGPESVPVLILGETGTGKEVVARALHEAGRKGKPFVALNCAAITESLAQSELFGHEKGSFTGATEVRAGAFERAEDGTIFLDEIGDLPLPLQAALLRVLETHEYLRVGGSKTKKTLARVIAATHQDLATAVVQGTFRRDLYYRLTVAEIRLKPLRERIVDIPELIHDLAPGMRFTPSAIDKLRAHEWPGNVRELSHVLTRAKIRRRDEIVRERDISFPTTPKLAPVAEAISRGTIVVEGRTMAQIELEVLRYALALARGNKTEAAKILKIPRQTFFDKLRKIQRKVAGRQ